MKSEWRFSEGGGGANHTSTPISGCRHDKTNQHNCGAYADQWSNNNGISHVRICVSVENSNTAEKHSRQLYSLTISVATDAAAIHISWLQQFVNIIVICQRNSVRMDLSDETEF